MMKDEALEEIRLVRERISAQYGHDITRFLNHYRELEKAYQDRLWPRPKRQVQVHQSEASKALLS
jgi:t-SNARE complex subunit (syntaxin)